eukprot:symbB.v1.2.000013.t1/scaffold5.1/size591573/13
MAGAGAGTLYMAEEERMLECPEEVKSDRRSRLVLRIGAALLGLVVLLVVTPLPGQDSGSILEGLVDASRMHTLEMELEKAGVPLPFEQKAHVSEEAGIVLCVVDVGQSIGRIMGVGNSIKSVVNNCDFDAIVKEERRPVTKDERQRCAVTIFGVMVNTALGIGAISSSVSTCSGSVNVPANCAANINAFIGNVLVLVGTAMSADLSCPLDPLPDRIEEKKEDFKEAKLDAQREINKWLKQNGQAVTNVLPPDPAVPQDEVFHSISRCVQHLDLAITFVMKSAVIIADSTVDCSDEELIDADAQRVCAINIIGLMGTLSLATRFFALASNSCVNIVGETTARAGCAADIAGINAGVYASVAPALNLQAACEIGMETWDPDSWPKRKDLRQSGTKQPRKRQRPTVNNGFTVIADP